MISKELLSEVLDSSFTVLEILEGKIDSNVYYKIEEIDILQSVNIYELAHKCKEWAWDNGYELLSGKVDSLDAKYEIIIEEINGYANDYGYLTNDEFSSDTEPEAIFKACEWILDGNS